MPPEATKTPMSKVGESGFQSSEEPLRPTAEGAEAEIDLTAIRKPKAAASTPPPASRQEPPAGGESSESDDDLLEAARRAASRGKKSAAPASTSAPENEEEGDKGGESRQEPPQPAAASKPASDISKETNLANLRKALDARAAEIEALKAERDALLPLKEKSTVFDAWEAERTKLTEQVQKLSPYRDLFAIRENPVFEQAYILPVNEAKAELLKLAKDYNASEDDVAALLEAKDKKALNTKLADMFGDETIPIGEARTHLANIARIEAKRVEAEKKPSETLAQLKAAQEQAAIAHGEQVVKEADASRKAGWEMALQINTRKDLEVEALVEIPGNKEHNERRAAIISDAQKLHSQNIAMIVKSGGRVDPRLASALAVQAQLAIASQVHEKDAAHWRAEHDKLLEKLNQGRQHERPGATTAPRTAAPKTPTKLSAREASRSIWGQVMSEE